VLFYSIFIFIFLNQSRADSPSIQLCPTVTLSGKIEPGLNSSEKRLICGDPESVTGAWKLIPPGQARYNLRNFLQERGYLHPVFTTNTEDGSISVDIGKPTRLAEIQVEGAPSELNICKRRGLLGEKLTPGLLKIIEDWVASRLQSMGYACPKIETNGDPDSGKVTVRIETGPNLFVTSIVEKEIPGLLPGILRRYDAFLIGKPFQRDWLVLTENRTTSDSIVQSTHFSHECRSDGVHLTQDSVPGLPRVLSAGIGINTEGLILAKTSWRSSRLGKTGSWIDVTLRGSVKEQKLLTSSHWYTLTQPSRFYLKPSIEAKHNDEKFYETLAAKTELTPVLSYDDQDRGYLFSTGPTLELLHTLRGQGRQRNAQFLSVTFRASMQSHDFEYFATSPRSGYSVAVSADFADESLFSAISAQRFRAQAEGLWNVFEYDPPLFVLGFRASAATIVTGERPGPNTKLPPLFLEFLGGSTTLRGFERKALPRDGMGALSSFYLGTEARLADVLPWGFEPFLFHDLGRLGLQPFAWDDPLYTSPGIGFRWASPIGVFRVTLARGYVNSTPAGYQFFLSYGEEF